MKLKQMIDTINANNKIINMLHGNCSHCTQLVMYINDEKLDVTDPTSLRSWLYALRDKCVPELAYAILDIDFDNDEHHLNVNDCDERIELAIHELGWNL